MEIVQRAEIIVLGAGGETLSARQCIWAVKVLLYKRGAP